ncbi:DNA oxidative demethylase AlkB [Ralstonia solanacearum]|uniref:DNA oxidative demethylase AlkB n=1 Tax=Ralstonia solanacearum TaxID=305 RepID=UPI0018D085DE|nr:DNA oxidative demethylase AlkB [Ralstonia solanacearum]
MTTRDLFADHAPVDERRIALGEAAFVLRGFALAEAPALLAAVDAIAVQAPLRHMVTPGGFEMSVALTNCGALGWTTDRRGYRYAARDPQTDRPWPPLPECFLRLAREAAAEADFPGFVPDACLINRYVPGARLSLHQDKDEQDYGAPIVSVSLGIPAMFLWGGHRRTDKTQRVPLLHGDVVVWGGPDRLRYHGVLPLKEAEHPLLGAQRINLTLRRAG